MSGGQLRFSYASATLQLRFSYASGEWWLLIGDRKWDFPIGGRKKVAMQATPPELRTRKATMSKAVRLISVHVSVMAASWSENFGSYCKLARMYPLGWQSSERSVNKQKGSITHFANF